MFTTPKRFWGEDLSEPKQVLSLEALHKLAQRRAEERGLATTKKRHLEIVSEADCGVSINEEAEDGEEEECKRTKHAKLATSDDQKKHKSKLKKDGKSTVSISTGERDSHDCTLESDEQGPNSNVMTVEMECDDAVVADSESDEDSDTVDEESVDQSTISSNLSLKRLSDSLDSKKQEGANEAAQLEPSSSAEQEDETTPSLAPLSSGQPEGKGKRIVQRQLPEWILNPTLIENDIQGFSRPFSEFQLPQVLVQNLEHSGMDKLFPVQAHVVPYLLSSLHGVLRTHPGGSAPSDVCVCAPTGCGKTLCYVLPVVTAMMSRIVKQVGAIVVVPSQELANQVHRVFELVARGTGVSAGMVCGQLSLESERAMLWNRSAIPPCSKVDVVIATPGRLVEHLDSGGFYSLRSLRFLVIDEADKLLDYHFNQWLPKLLKAVSRDKTTPRRCGPNSVGMGLEGILKSLCLHPERFKLMKPRQSQPEILPTMLPEKFCPLTSPLQKLLFSATMTQNPQHFALLQLHYPKLFTISDALQLRGVEASELTFGLPEQLVEKRVRCDLQHKPLALAHLVIKGCGEGWSQEEMRKVLCFTNSKESTHRLYLLLKALNYFPVAEISSSLARGQRQKVLADFQDGSTHVLICSDQMARGMDVEGVSCVVNYEPPRQFRVYLHRAGRTARAGQRGVVYTLLAQDEVHAFNVMMRQVKRDQRLVNVKIKNSDLQDMLPQYQDALDMLRDSL